MGPEVLEKPLVRSAMVVVQSSFPGPRVERHQARVGRREEDLVLVDRDVAHRAEADGLVRADLVLPDQVAGRGVQGLHHVHGVGEIHDAVVHERVGLVGAAFVHRPRPRQAQVLDVGAGDFGERAVAPRLVIAAGHQPVAGRRRAQHLVGDRHVVRHLALHAVSARRRGSLRPRAGLCPCARGAGGGAARSRIDHAGGCHTGRHRTNDGARRRCERLRARCRAVGGEQIGGDVQVIFRAERASRPRRHRALDGLEQLRGRLPAPGVHEVRAGERRGFVTALEIGQVTARATRAVHRAPRRHLGRSEHRRPRRRLCHDCWRRGRAQSET